MRRRRKRLPRRVVLRLQVRPRAPPPAPPRHLAGSILRTAGIIRLLLETPTGFGIFSFDGAYLKKDYNDIWSYFADELWLRKAIWLKELLLFENKSIAINLETGDIHANLVEFLKKWCDSKEKLVVEREEYKRIIERNMEITCLYDDNVEEVMWGLKNNMGYLVLEEKTVLAKKVCLPMSKRFEMFLSRYGFDMKPEMVNNHIAQKAAILHRNDLSMEKHSVFFDLVRESIKNTSAMDTVGWSAIKLATAAVMMCYSEKIPEACDRSKIFSPHERSKIKEYASECQDVLLKSDPWVVYKNVLFLSEKRSKALAQLTCLVEKTDAAFKSDEAFVMSEPLLITSINVATLPGQPGHPKGHIDLGRPIRSAH